MKPIAVCWVGVMLLCLLAGAGQASYPVRGNVDSRIYHNANCHYFTCAKCTAVFSSPQEAQRNGFRACNICKG